MIDNTPGQTLETLIRNYGWGEFTIEPIDSDMGVSYDCHDLGNGNQAYGFISQMTDGVYCTPGEDIDMTSCNFQDWDNLSRYYTRQHGRPNVMHDCESIGNTLAEDIARVPGEYATPYITWYCDNDCDCGGDMVLPSGEYCEPDIQGWLLLYRDIFNTVESQWNHTRQHTKIRVG